jgi:hypothetical protein
MVYSSPSLTPYKNLTGNICLSGVISTEQISQGLSPSFMFWKSTSDNCHTTFSLSEICDENPKNKIEYFAYEDLKYNEVAKKNLKQVLRKRKIKNIEECFSILDSLAPSSTENFIKKVINKNNKISVLKILRKLKISDPIFMEQ